MVIVQKIAKKMIMHEQECDWKMGNVTKSLITFLDKSSNRKNNLKYSKSWQGHMKFMVTIFLILGKFLKNLHFYI